MAITGIGMGGKASFGGTTTPAAPSKADQDYWAKQGYTWNTSTGAYEKTSDTGGSPKKGGGSYSTTSTAASAAEKTAMREAYYNWFGFYPSNYRIGVMVKNGWTEDTLRRFAVASGYANGALMVQARERLQQIAAPYYNGDPSAVPASIINALISGGQYADETYLSQTYFPKLLGANLTNPLAQSYVDAWVEMTGRPPTEDAINQLDQLVRAYGYTDTAMAAFSTWAKGTNDAVTGNYGAERRAGISGAISTLLGREATDEELSATGNWWNLEDDALVEALRATDEYQGIYAGKPAYMSESDWVAQAKAINAVFHWYYGDNVATNPDGSITIGGETIEVPEGTIPSGLSRFGIDFITTDMLSSLLEAGYSAEQLSEEFKISEQAIATAAQYNDNLLETLGAGFTAEEWRTYISGGAGSGELKAKIQEAQNKIAYREAYRQVFGVDPDVADYDRITTEYLSPDSLIKEGVAIQSAEEMYDEINELMGRIYNESITVDELKDMALGREGSGELKALIRRATELDTFTEMHMKYYGAAATPDDYAKYDGYASSNQLQWEITTQEAVDENMDIITQAWADVYPDEPMITESDLYKMYGGQEGGGEISAKVSQAKKLYEQKQSGEQWAMYGADRTTESYTGTQAGTFKVATPGLGNL